MTLPGSVTNVHRAMGSAVNPLNSDLCEACAAKSQGAVLARCQQHTRLPYSKEVVRTECGTRQSCAGPRRTVPQQKKVRKFLVSKPLTSSGMPRFLGLTLPDPDSTSLSAEIALSTASLCCASYEMMPVMSPTEPPKLVLLSLLIICD